MKYFVPSRFLQPLKTLCIERYVDPTRILAQANLPLAALHDPDMLIDHYDFATALNTAARVMKDPLLGFNVGRQVHLPDLGFIGSLFTHQTVLANIYPILNYLFNVQERGARHKLKVQHSTASHYLEFLIADKVDCHQLAQLALAGFNNIFKQIVGERWRPDRITFCTKKHLDVTEMQKYFNCPVVTGKARDAIEFPSAFLYQKPEDALLITKAAKIELARLLHEFDDLERLVCNYIESFLPEMKHGKEHVAKSLGVHPRVLQECLNEQGLCYRDMINQTRRKLALELLTQTQLPITVISQQLGYQSTSPFIRAFKQYYGITPLQWRKSNKI